MRAAAVVFALMLQVPPHAFAIDDADSDNDGLTNDYENNISHTNPNDSDSDHDGAPDGQEIREGYDPNNPNSYPPRFVIVKSRADYSFWYSEELAESNYFHAQDFWGANLFGSWGYLDNPLDFDMMSSYLESYTPLPTALPAPPQHYYVASLPISAGGESMIYGSWEGAYLQHAAFWLQVSPAPTQEIKRTVLKVTKRWASGTIAGSNTQQGPYADQSVEAITFTIPATTATPTVPLQAVTSNRQQLLPSFLYNPSVGYLHAFTEQVTVSLLPVELRDIKDHGDTGDDVTITNWDTTQQIADNNIAWIEAHSSISDPTPRMPQLELRIPGLQGMTIEAKLEVQYDRGNGQRTARNQPEDRVRIPESGNFQTVTGDTWRIWESYAGQLFFGGEATLTYRLMTLQNQVIAPQTVRFRIGGKNPDAARARQFIETLDNAGQQGSLWFAYAIAKSESKDYNGTGTRYNQFWQLPRGPNDNAYRTTRKTHVGRPVFGNDPSGPGGYGLFQVTGTATSNQVDIPRNQIWDWQENCRAALQILDAKRNDADNWMTQQKNGNNANGVALPSLTVRNISFAEGTNRLMNHAVTIKAWNGAGRPAAGFTDPEPAVSGFIIDPQGSGHFCYWKNSASGTNKWALNRYNAFNPPFNYVDRVCQEVE